MLQVLILLLAGLFLDTALSTHQMPPILFQSLPREIQDECFDAIPDHQRAKALATCFLVSRDWCLHARKRFYREIVLKDEIKFNKPEEATEPAESKQHTF